MVTITMSPLGAKNAANRLREFLAIDGINLKQTHAYEALARALGYANWNTLQALLNGAPLAEPAENPAAAPLVDAHGRVYTVERLAEQAARRIAIPFDPTKFDKFVGCYQFDPEVSPDEWRIFTRKGDQLLMRVSGEKKFTEICAESETKFFAITHTPQQVSFNVNAQGYTESLVYHVSGQEYLLTRVDESVVRAFEDALQKYVTDNKPSPEREVVLRRLIAACYAGTPTFEEFMAPWVVEGTKRQWPAIQTTFRRLGKLTELKFLHVKNIGVGVDVYRVVFENGELIWEVGPLTRDGKLTHTWYDFP